MSRPALYSCGESQVSPVAGLVVGSLVVGGEQFSLFLWTISGPDLALASVSPVTILLSSFLIVGISYYYSVFSDNYILFLMFKLSFIISNKKLKLSL